LHLIRGGGVFLALIFNLLTKGCHLRQGLVAALSCRSLNSRMRSTACGAERHASARSHGFFEPGQFCSACMLRRVNGRGCPWLTLAFWLYSVVVVLFFGGERERLIL